MFHPLDGRKAFSDDPGTKCHAMKLLLACGLTVTWFAGSQYFATYRYGKLHAGGMWVYLALIQNFPAAFTVSPLFAHVSGKASCRFHMI